MASIADLRARAAGAAVRAAMPARALALAAWVALVAAGVPAQELRQAVAAATAAGVRVAVCARDVDDGALVFAHRADVPQLPASNQKLVTAYAFLAGLGADYRFRTGFRVEGGVLKVRAGGDPNWIAGGPVDPAPTLARIAEQLRGAGIRGVRGVELERGPFTGPGRPDDWPADQRLRDYCAPTGACVLEQGCWVAEVGPGGSSAAVRVLGPPAGLRVVGSIGMTSDRRRGGRFHLEVRDGELVVRGNFLKGAEARTVRGAVDDPEALFVRSLEVALGRAGIGVDPGADDVDLELEDVTSPVGPALRRAMTDSSNFDAEQLLRTLGAEKAGDGSFAGGVRAVTMVIERELSRVPDGVRFGDGSGLSRANRATAAFLVDLLIHAARGPHLEAFVGALPRAGRDGTLERRFDDSDVAERVRAKTGSLAGASALSGYLRTRDARTLAFSILMEWDRPVRGPSPKVLEERIVEALDAID